MSDDSWKVAYLEARCAYLEKVLAERSVMLRTFARDALIRSSSQASRAAMGLPPFPRAGFGLRGWQETNTLAPAEVEATMLELWRSVTPPNFGDGE